MPIGTNWSRFDSKHY